MQKSYECELATHIGPESCGAAREGGVEALTGETAGRVLSRVMLNVRGADAVEKSGFVRSGWRTAVLLLPKPAYPSPAPAQPSALLRKLLLPGHSRTPSSPAKVSNVPDP